MSGANLESGPYANVVEMKTHLLALLGGVGDAMKATYRSISSAVLRVRNAVSSAALHAGNTVSSAALHAGNAVSSAAFGAGDAISSAAKAGKVPTEIIGFQKKFVPYAQMMSGVEAPAAAGGVVDEDPAGVAVTQAPSGVLVETFRLTRLMFYLLALLLFTSVVTLKIGQLSVLYFFLPLIWIPIAVVKFVIIIIYKMI